MSVILTLGLVISAILVILGSAMYLSQHGSERMPNEFIQPAVNHANVTLSWTYASLFSSFGLIKMGLLTLVATQIIRVGLLVGFYSIMRDYWFTFISLFIMIVLVYSFFWRD